MSSSFYFEPELKKSLAEIKNISAKIGDLKKEQDLESEELEQLYSEVFLLAEKAGISMPRFVEPTSVKTSLSKEWTWNDQFFLNYHPEVTEAKIREEVFRNPALLPSLSSLDYAIVGLSGLVASIVDFLVVRIPKNINYLSHYQQKGSNFTSWLRSLGVDQDGKLSLFIQWCEEVCKLPYDQSINPDIKGFTPKTHRLLSLGHDPLFGLIFGTADILNGSLTTFDISGKLQIIKTFDLPLEGQIIAPFIWLGHIVSDLCTKMGIPIPGWGFLQLLQIGSFGTSQKTVAEIFRWMYLNGYDVRHFVTMSVSVAVVEIIVRAYQYLSVDKPIHPQSSLYSFDVNKETSKIQANLKLHKMLFLSHTLAASGNAIKVFTYAGNPLSINLPQWLILLKESAIMIKAVTRDTTHEKVIRNRMKITKEWQEIQDIIIRRFD